MRIEVRPGTLRGTAVAPPSKSVAHRLLIGAALAEGTTTLTGVAQSEDIAATLDGITALGGTAVVDGTTVTVTGRTGKTGADFPCRESGSTLRFLIPAALLEGGTVRFTGSPRLMERGIGVYETLFREKGITVRQEPTAVTLCGRLAPGEFVLPGDVSSQFVTGFLFALPLLEAESVIRVLPPVESRSYIDLTLGVLADFGVEVQEEAPGVFRIPGNQHYRSGTFTVGGDWSNGAALLAFAALGDPVEVTRLELAARQGDRVCVELFQKLEEPGAVIDLADCPDLGPILFAVAAAKNGAAFTGTRRLRIKESDRTAAMAEVLAAFGIRAEVGENNVRVFPGALCRPSAPVDCRNDHRIVMAATLLASRVGAVLDGAEAVRKSWPDYFEVLRDLGLEAETQIRA